MEEGGGEQWRLAVVGNETERVCERAPPGVWKSLGGSRDALGVGLARPRRHRTWRELLAAPPRADASEMRRVLLERRLADRVDPEAVVTSLLAELLCG